MYSWESWALNKLFLELIMLDFWDLRLSSVARCCVPGIFHKPCWASWAQPFLSPSLKWDPAAKGVLWRSFKTPFPEAATLWALRVFCQHLWECTATKTKDLRGLQNAITFTYVNLLVTCCLHSFTHSYFLPALQYSQLWTVRVLLNMCIASLFNNGNSSFSLCHHTFGVFANQIIFLYHKHVTLTSLPSAWICCICTQFFQFQFSVVTVPRQHFRQHYIVDLSNSLLYAALPPFSHLTAVVQPQPSPPPLKRQSVPGWPFSSALMNGIWLVFHT